MTTLNLQVSASSDDARENSGTVGLTAPSINASGTNQKLGFRVDNVTIDQGETVIQALLSLYVTSTDNDTPNGATIYGDDSDDAATFSTSTNNLSSRTTTTASVTWSGSNIGSGWAALDVTAIVQEIIDRPGWASGNAIAFVLYGVSGMALTITTYDGNPSQAAKLDIEYAGLQTVETPYLDASATLYAPVSITGASATALTMPYLDASATLYEGMAHVGTWKVEEVIQVQPGAVTLFNVPIAASAAEGRAAVLYMTLANGTYPNAIAPMTIESDNGSWVELFSSSCWVIWATDSLNAAGDELVVRSAGYPFTFAACTIVVFSGVDGARLVNDTLVDYGESYVELTGYYPTNSAFMGMSQAFDSAPVSQTPAANFFAPTGDSWDTTHTYTYGTWYQTTLVYFRPVPGGASGTITGNATITGDAPPIQGYEQHALMIPGIQADLYPPYLDATATLYPPERIYLDTATVVDAPYLDATATLYAPSVVATIDMPYIDASAVLYAPEVEQIAGPAQYIELPYLGRGVPIVVNGAYIDATATLNAPGVFTEIDMPYITATATLNAPTIAAVVMSYGGVYAPTEIAHV